MTGVTGLENYIVDNPLNRNNLDSLFSSFKKDSFVPFIGAGPSTVLGAADWKDLITNLCKSFGVKKFKKVKNNGNIDYPRSFSKIFKILNDRGFKKEEFYKKLFECIKPTATEATFFHLKLVKLFNACVTTNYDSPIEKAFQEHYRKAPSKYFFSSYGLNNFKDCIVYLHGHKEINFCIIKAEDYEYFYPSVSKKNGIPIIEEFLTEIFTKKSVIFVGFSFDDPYISNYMDLLESLEPFKNVHYWLISESTKDYSETMQRAEEYKKAGAPDKAKDEVITFYNGKRNIKPIVYKGHEHIFVEKLFETLTESLPVGFASGEISGIPVR